MMNYGIIDVYSGDPPQYAHQAPTGTWLARITTNGDTFIPGTLTGGLTLNGDTMGVLRDTGDWVLQGVAYGTAGWWRWKWRLEDPNTTDPYYPRIDGDVGTSLVLASKTITPATLIAIDSFYMTIGS
jgi:hypothetical protein